MKEIIVTIDAQGNTVITTKGFAGTECLKETAEIEKALGAKTKDERTRESFTAARQVNRVTQ
tara:strand:+ start:217 stop:402 length:186 start_codon:yes stop_codon:yes gene_type:complete